MFATSESASISGRLPVALFLALVVSDEAPPFAGREDRNSQDGHDALTLQPVALRVRELPDGSGDEIARGQDLLPTGEAALRVREIRRDVEVDRRIDAGGGPLEDLRHLHRAVGTPAVPEHVGAAGFGRLAGALEHVVDTVRPRRLVQEPFGREARRLEDQIPTRERLLRHLALRDVRQDALPRGLPAQVVDQGRVVVDPDRSPVLGDDPVLQIEGLAADVRAVRLRDHGIAIVGMQHPQPQARFGQPVLGGVPREQLVLRADVDRGRHLVDRVDVDGGREPLDQVAVARLGLSLTRLGFVASRDVFDDALPHRPVSVALDHHRGVADPHDRPVTPQEPVFDLEPLARALRPAVLLLHAFAVVRVDQLGPRLGPRHPLAGRDAGQLLDLRRHVRQDVVAVRILLVGEIRHDGQLLDQLPEPLLRALLLGDVEHHPGVDGAPSRARRHGDGLVPDPHPSPVRGPQAVLRGERFLAR